jgi:hypothetical protein
MCVIVGGAHLPWRAVPGSVSSKYEIAYRRLAMTDRLS